MFASIKSSSRSILGHSGSKTRTPSQIKGKLVNTRGHFFEVIIMDIAQNVFLDDFKFKSKTGSLGVRN